MSQHQSKSGCSMLERSATNTRISATGLPHTNSHFVLSSRRGMTCLTVRTSLPVHHPVMNFYSVHDRDRHGLLQVRSRTTVMFVCFIRQISGHVIFHPMYTTIWKCWGAIFMALRLMHWSSWYIVWICYGHECVLR